MKKNLLFICSLICFFMGAIRSTAQPYQKFLYNHNEWDVYADLQPMFALTPAYMSGPVIAAQDTVVGLYTYKKTFTRSEDSIFPGSKPCLLREDTITRQVFILSADSTSERVIYDFSLTTGDSILLEFRYENSSNLVLKSGWYYVDSTGLINTISGVRNSWYLSNPLLLNLYPSIPQLTWIEGIGSTISPVYLDEDFNYVYLITNPQAQYYLSLTCAFHDGVDVFHDSAWSSIYANGITLWGDSCIFQLTGGIHENEGLLSTLAIQPNPVHDYAFISLSNPVTIEKAGYHVFMYDVTGRKMESYIVSGNQLSNGFEWKPVNVSPGTVFITVYNDKQLVAVGKLMVK